MAVVAGFNFAEVPSVTEGFCHEWLKKWPSRIPFRNTPYECSPSTRPMIVRKGKRFFKAPQTEIAKPLAHKVSCFSLFQSPEIQLAFSAVQSPPITSFSGKITKEAADLWWKQIQCAFPPSGTKASRKTSACTLVGLDSTAPLMTIPA